MNTQSHPFNVKIVFSILGHPPSPGQAAMRGFQWLVTELDIRLTTSTQGRPGLITPVTLITKVIT